MIFLRNNNIKSIKTRILSMAEVHYNNARRADNNNIDVFIGYSVRGEKKMIYSVQ